MKLIILAGGLGTRLREETEFRPKPMVDIGGRPIIWHIMKYFSCFGVREFVICAGYKGEIIKDYFLNYRANTGDFTVRLGRDSEIKFHDEPTENDWSVSVVDTGQETMTGGRLLRVRDHVGDSPFLLTYGDGLSNIDIAGLLSFHETTSRKATVAAVRPLSRFGVMDLNQDGAVIRFREKPQSDDYVNAGVFVFETGIFELLEGDETVLEQAPLQRLAEDNQLTAYRHDSFWQPMDTYREFTLLNDLWKTGAAPWAIWR